MGDIQYEQSVRAREVTELVEMWIMNDGDHYHRALAIARMGHERLGQFLLNVLTESIGVPYSAPWFVMQDVMPSDFSNDRIHWDDIAATLLAP